MFFGDTEHKYIHISEPLLVKFDNVIPQSNNLKSVKLMRLELENDLGKLQKELLHEKNEIRELMKKINMVSELFVLARIRIQCRLIRFWVFNKFLWKKMKYFLKSMPGFLGAERRIRFFASE